MGPTTPVVAPPIMHDVLRSPGQPLDQTTRSFFEPRFGHDFSRVRVHSDAAAATSSRAIGARAYAAGEQIVFGAGQYRPESRSGLRLLAHELSHVVQQSAIGQPEIAEGQAGSPLLGLIQRQPQATQQTDTDTGSQASATPSLAQGATELTQKGGAPSTLQSLSFEGTLVAGQTLPGSDSDKTIHTLTDTRVNISVTAKELYIWFTPALVITSGTWPHPDMQLTHVSFDFTAGTFGFGAEGPNYAWWIGNAKDKLTAGLAGLFGAMPSAMRVPGYNPFSDANIQSNLAAFFSNMSSPSGSAPADMPKATGLKMSATVTLGGEIRQTSGRFSLVIPSGTSITISVNLSGGIPTNLRDIRISSLDLKLWHPGNKNSNVEFRVLDAGFPLIYISSATFSSGGHLQFSYVLASEVVEAAGRRFLAELAVAAGQGGQIGEDALRADQPKLHAFVDALLHSNLEPLLQDLILANRHAIPGMDLGEALGFGPEMGDFPSPKPGAASG